MTSMEGIVDILPAIDHLMLGMCLTDNIGLVAGIRCPVDLK
jgi:hypothetical protein